MENKVVHALFKDIFHKNKKLNYLYDLGYAKLNLKVTDIKINDGEVILYSPESNEVSFPYGIKHIKISIIDPTDNKEKSKIIKSEKSRYNLSNLYIENIKEIVIMALKEDGSGARSFSLLI